MNQIEKLQPRTRAYSTIRTDLTHEDSAHWLYMHADAATGIRPCCRPEMLDEMWSFMSQVTRS